MTSPPISIGRVKLARSLPRLLALPVLLLVLGLAGIAAGALVVAGTAGIGLLIAGALLALDGVAMALVVLSVRLEVEESAVRVTWLGGGRRYLLSQGPVTRVRLRGPTASRLQMRSGVFGWGPGRAVLRGEEAIHIVRLAPTATAILVPTDRGRLAIAPARDDDLLDALSRAARARHRLEALAAQAAEAAALPETDAAALAPPAADAEAEIEAREVPEPEPAPEAQPLTGIERALLEARLAEEARAAEEAAAAAAAAETEAPSITEAAEPTTPEAVVAAPAPEKVSRTAIQRRRARAAFVFLPLLGAGLAWFAGLATGRMPEAGTDLARLTSLALVMAGPATSVGAVMALAWWPRLVGVVVTGGLLASVFIFRALLAP